MSNKFTKWVGALLTLILCTASINVAAQTVVFSEDFESGTDNWTFTVSEDPDGDGPAQGGAGYEVSPTGYESSGSLFHGWLPTAAVNDDWAISPLIDLTDPSYASATVSWMEYNQYTASWYGYQEVAVS